MDNDEYFADKCYAAWRDGENPDDCSRDEYDRLLASGYYPDEITYQDIIII